MKRFSYLTFCLFSSTCLAGGVARAQPPPPEPAPAVPAQPAAAEPTGTLDEIIVTARKRNERLNDVPMSISAATGDQLKARGVTQVGDLDKVVPGFAYQPSNYGTPVYSIRGVGFIDVAVAVAPTVSIYVDQVPLPYSVMTEGSALDVQRVEVLKGPQGTAFGQNSTGGAINFIANKPTPAFAAGANASYGNFNAVNVNGFASGPMTDTLSGRIAINTDQRGPWQQSETRSARLGRRDFSDGRILLDWKPRDDLRFELNFNGWLDKSDTQAAQMAAYSPLVPNGYPDLQPALAAYKPAPKNDRIADWDPGVSLRRNDSFGQVSLRSDWDISPKITLTGITAFSNLSQLSPNDLDGTPYDNIAVLIRAHVQSFSQELRLAGHALDDKLNWMVGGNYGDDITSDYQQFKYNGTSSGIGPLEFHDFLVTNNQVITTAAAFATLDYKLPYNLTVSGSARYTSADDNFHGCLRDPGNGAVAAAFSQLASAPIPAGHCVTLDPATLAAVPIVKLSLDEQNVSWRGGLSWEPTSATLVYVNATRGYKAGSFPTLPGFVPSQFAPVPQESVLAFEAGFKRTLAPLRLQLDGAVFYYDYDDKQILGYVNTLFGNLPRLISIPKSSVRGAEVNAIWRPVRALTINAGATYIDSQVDKSLLTNDPFNNIVDIRGEAFPNTPKWTASGDAQYDFPLTERLSGYMGASGRYRTESVAAFGSNPLFREPAYGTLDLRTGVQSGDGRWRVELWGRNVTDQFYLTNITHIVDTVAQTTGMPATYGVTLGWRY